MAKKILIADDDDHIRELVQFALEDGGYELFFARDGLEALARAREAKPDLMVLDVMMPGKVGYEVCEELKKDPATQGIYIILMSARGRSKIEVAGKMQGADDIMPKPFDPLELAEKVKKALG
jgi:DNA-binding response OmpR family regulator